MKIEDVLSQIGQGVLTEESTKMLTEAFNEAVERGIQEKVTLQVEQALKQLDEEHSTKLEQLLEAIDNDHSNKLVSVVEKLDQDHTEKLTYLVSAHKKELHEDAKKFKSDLVSQISNYLDVYLDKAVPAEQLKEAVENKRAQKILGEMKQILALDEQFINDTVKEAVKDGKDTIDMLKQELNEAVKHNIELSQSLKVNQASLILEKNTKDFSKEKKDYVLRVLSEKNPEYITENFDYVVKMFDKDEEEKAQLLTDEAPKSSRVLVEKVDTPKTIKESTNSETPSNGESVTGYLSALKKQDRK